MSGKLLGLLEKALLNLLKFEVGLTGAEYAQVEKGEGVYVCLIVVVVVCYVCAVSVCVHCIRVTRPPRARTALL
jgi:hypothetical protein